ncbi:HAD family hydrolase [Acetonema longum]|uniref:Hydrolase n=1 Tax=Acetonema longum DSM 6540 TaxID=1009370 RepID=F7NGW6_9FIRM|nr:HAD family phosphatase [Acetonema longum]EGO64697.1 hydrolase [Acetonema longum DSM 6540]
MKKIKAIIFDLDGTLVDSEPNYFASDKRLLAEYGIPDFDEAMKNKYVGIGSREMLEDLKQIYPITESMEVLLRKKNDYYLEIARTGTVAYPEMIKFLHLLKDSHYPVALASGSSPEVIELVLSVTGLTGQFDVVLSAENVKRGKPSPDIFLEAARRLGVPAENCLVVEDSRYGVEAAQNAGMYCIALPCLAADPLPDCFGRADFLCRNGIADFTAEKAFAWVTGLSEQK